MFSPQSYTAVNGLDLHDYYNVPDQRALGCELCPPDRGTGSPLKRYELYDGRTRWYFCAKCGFAGTALDYLAAQGKQHPVQTLHKLVRKGHLQTLDAEQIRSYHEYLRGVRQFRDRYRECPPFSRTASAPLSSLENLDDYFQVRRYRMGDRKSFERLFHPGATRHGASGSRLFHGRNWGRITAIPLYDLPLRMSGILFVNGLREGNGSITIKRLGPRQGGIYAFDPGFLATSEILSTSDAAEAVVVSSDWLRVLRFQTDIWHQQRRIAPIVGWFPVDPRTQRAWCYRWNVFQNIPKIFWSAQNDILNLREACLQNAMISHAYYRPDSSACVLPENLLPGAVLRSVIQSAVMWHQALLWHLGDDPATMESKLSVLQLPKRTLEQFLPHVPNPLRKFLTAQFSSGEAASRYVDGVMVLENIDGWHRAASHPHIPPSLLSSARCLVDRVLCFAGKEPMYQGRILINSEIHPFVEAESVIEKNAIRFIRQVCVEKQSAYLPVINVSSEKMLKLIRAYGNFQVVSVRSGFGWDDETASLILPNMTVSDTTVVAPELPLDYGPFSSLVTKHAQPLTPGDMQVLASFREETPYILAMFVSMLPVLFAPAYRMETPQTVVLSPNTELLEQLFAMLNLPVSLKSITQTITDYSATHRCPYLLRFGSSQSHVKNSRRQTWSEQVGFHGCGYIAASLPAALARMSFGRANMLMMPRIRFYRWLQGRLPDVYLKCLVALLRHFSRYVLEPKITSENFNSDMIQEAVRFLESELGLSVHKGTLFEGYYDCSTYFCDYVTLLQRNEELTVTSTAGEMTISVTALGECYRNHLGVFDFERIRETLAASMLLKEYDSAKHLFLVDPAPFAASPKRVEVMYRQ